MAKRIGTITCDGATGCGHHMWVEENAQGTLTYKCAECGRSGFAKTGQKHARKVRATLDTSRLDADDIPAASPPAPAKPGGLLIGD